MARMLRLFSALIVVAGTAASARQPAGDLTAYRQVVDRYRDLRATTHDEVVRLTKSFSPVVARVVDPSSGWTAIDLTAAAMLHTDACLRLLKSGNQPDALAHVEAATTLLDAAVGRAPEHLDFTRRWYVVVGGLIHAYGAPGSAADLQVRWINRFPESTGQAKARAAFERGLAREIQAAGAGMLSGPEPRRLAEVVPPEALSSLRSAAREYEAALSIDPAFADAALHLGRIRIIDRAELDAVRWLQVAGRAHRRPDRYMAMMFLGAIAERQGNFTDAEAQYRAALDTFRWGQSAPFALSHLLTRVGREAEARETLASHFKETAGRVVDPLWTYLAEPSAHLGPALDELRAEVWR